MKIRKKTNQEIKKDINTTTKNIEMGVIRHDLFGELTKNNYPKYLTKSKKLEQQRNIFEKDGTLVLRICNDKLNILHSNKDRNSTTSRVIIEFGKYQEHLYLHKKLEQGKITDLKILIQHDNGSYELHIPNKDKQELLSYLIEGNPPKKFDCQSFIHTIKGIHMKTHSENAKIITKKWMMSKKDPNELKAGDCICLFNYFSNNDTSYNGVKHFAYYLGNGLFISKFGEGGDICVSNLQEMHNFYGSKEFVSMIPNPYYIENTIHNPSTE